jgi:arylsulfatase A-like enzyme
MTLADYLHKSGYTLSFLSGQDESFGDVASSVGMKDEGVHLFDARTAINDRVYSSTDSGSLRLSEARMVQEFRQHTKVMDWARPQFLYVNLQAAHFPYSHPAMPTLVNDLPIPRSEIRSENREWVEATYWNAVANADWAVGEIMKQLRMLGVYEDTLVIIVSDHGESLFNDGFLGHGHALNEAQTRIPLITNRPGLAIRQAIGQVDLAELIVRLATRQYNSEDWQDSEHGVFQLVGSLHRPQLVGTVSYGEQRTILDLRTQRVYFSDLKRWVDLNIAQQDQNLASRIHDLILQWETLRWRDYLAQRGEKLQWVP